VSYEVIDQILIRLFPSIRNGGEKWECSEAIHQLFVDLKEAYDSVRKEVLCSVLLSLLCPLN
jgi:hypothetical protein